MAKRLLLRGVDHTQNDHMGRTPLYSAAMNGNAEILNLLLEKEAEITIANGGWTPVNAASSNSYLEVVELLVEKGSDITVASNNGWTPVNAASNNGHLEVVKLLLEEGADPYLQGETYRNAL